MKRNLRNGLASEHRVLDELKRRNIPVKHRVDIEFYEIDILVGNRIIVEVDGYVHATKASIEKDARKDEHLEALGFIVLHITGTEAKNRGALRDFGRKVLGYYRKEQQINVKETTKPLTQPLPGDALEKLREKLVDERCVEPPAETPVDEPKSDGDLFREWIQREDPPDKE